MKMKFFLSILLGLAHLTTVSARNQPTTKHQTTDTLLTDRVVIEEAISDNDQRLAPITGEVFWIRHGESEGNEKNVFSGIVDLKLTAYGQLQGKRAAEDLKIKFGSKGGTFDRVFTSFLHRAIHTKQLALGELDPPDQPRSTMIKDSTEIVVSTEICERSQGIFTGENKALVMSLFGPLAFEEFLTDASHCPLGGESGGEVFDRCKAFYEKEIAPRVAKGENILIVCHEFVMMAMAVYLDGRHRDEFVHFKVPNGKALSNAELVGLLNSETDPFNDRLKALGDWTTVHALKGSFLLYVIGGLIRVASGSIQGLPSVAFKVIIVGLNALSSLYTYLDVDLKSTSKNVSLVAVLAVVVSIAIRWTIAVPVIKLVKSGKQDPGLLRNSWMLWLLIPPAMTSPAVARLVGGNVYECATLSPVLNMALPLLLYILLEVGVLPLNLAEKNALAFFWAILAGGLWFPCAMSQFSRWWNPVETAKHTNKWKFLTGWCFMFLGLFGGFQTCPPQLFDFIHHVNGGGDKYNLSPLSWALGIWLALRFTSISLTSLLRKKSSLVERQLVDIFVLLTSPNFFLWLSLRREFTSMTTFWAGFFFFGANAFEHHLKVNALGRRLCKASIGGSMLSPAKIDEMLHLFDADSNGVFDEEEFNLLLQHFYRNSGEPVPNEKLLRLLTHKMMEKFGQDRNGSVPLEAVRNYLKGNGCFVNFNNPTIHEFSVKDRRSSSIDNHAIAQDSRTSVMWGALTHGTAEHVLEGLLEEGFVEDNEAAAVCKYCRKTMVDGKTSSMYSCTL